MTAHHGYRLGPAEHRLLRGRPPDQALSWVLSVLGPGTRIVTVRASRGGTSSAIHALTVEHRDGRRDRVILRRYVRTDWLASEPDLAAHEATVLDLLERCDLPVPRLLGVDPTGRDCDVPAVLMTRLVGRIDWEPADVDHFVRDLAEPLPLIHGVSVPATALLRPYDPYYVGRDLRPPTWAAHPAAWSRAIEVHAGAPPPAPPVFIHRDYHPGNILWSRGRVTGIVDWASASRGAGQADVGHCRENLAVAFDMETADRFLRQWQSLAGASEYHPYWDIAAVIGMLPEMHLTSPSSRSRLDDFVTRAAARL